MSLPGGPTDSPEEQRRRWPGGARRKNPYAYKPLPHDDEDIPMSKRPDEKNGLPSTSKGTEETSFIEGTPLGRIMTAAEQLTTREVELDFPFMDTDRFEVRCTPKGVGTGSIIEVKMRNKTKWYHLLTKTRGDDEKTFNENLPKEIQTALDPYRGVRIKAAEIQQKAQQREELNKTIEEDRKIADDENEQPSVRSRTRERITENTERKARLEQEQNQLEQEREQIEERLPLRERLKNLFKKHGFTIATVVTAVGITIGVLAKILADGASAAANGIKTVGKKVGDGLKDLGKRIGAIFPGLVGAIASFVFRAAGQAISFLAKNAWLIILAVAAFMTQKLTEKK